MAAISAVSRYIGQFALRSFLHVFCFLCAASRRHYDKMYKISAVAEMSDRGHHRHEPKTGGCARFRGRCDPI